MQESYSHSYANLWRNHWWWRVRHRLVMRTVAQCLRSAQLPGRARIFDVGCAGGLTLDDLSQFGDVYGLEPDPHLIDSCPHWRDRVELTEFSRHYRAKRSYHLVLMLDVLEHIEDEQGAIQGLWNLLEPGGQLILTVPALESLWSVHDEINRHFRRYRRRELGERLAAQGFEVLDLQYFFAWSLPLLYLRRLLLGTKRRQGQDYAVRVPSKPINALFSGLSRCELWLMRMGVRWPLGSSLLAVARRPLQVP